MADATPAEAAGEALPKGAEEGAKEKRSERRRLRQRQPCPLTLTKNKTKTNPTEFETARPLALPEVRAILAARRAKQEEEEGAAAPPPPLQAKALAYAERFDAIRSAVRADEAAAALGARGVLTPAEAAALINLMPGTAEEARALIPSLGGDGGGGVGGGVGERSLADAELQEILDELQTFKGLD